MTPPHIEKAAREWRCFHCDEVFNDVEAAAEHFGCILDEPACKLTEQEGGILALLRDAQRQLDEYRNDADPSSRAFYALGAEHSMKLIRAEQEGYDKGLADGQALARAHTIEEAAKVADAYADENIMMAQDSIINDPLLSKLCGRNIEVTVTNADFDVSESMIVDGTIHSSMFHAAQNIAAAIRALIPKEG